MKLILATSTRGYVIITTSMGCLVLLILWIRNFLKTVPQPLENSPHDRHIMGELNMKKAGMDNEQMIRIIRQHFIENPSNEPYSLDDPGKLDFSSGQAPFVDNRLGFLVGCMGI